MSRVTKADLAGDHQFIGYRLRGFPLRWLKILHVCFAALWAGATVCLTLVQYGFDPANGAQMHAYRAIVWIIDRDVVAPSALLCMVTGFFYSAMTPYGFVKYWWVILKWIVTVCYNLAGFLVLSPWLERMARLSWFMDPAGPVPAGSILLSALQGVVAAVQLCVVAFMVLVTVFKPWGHTRWHV
ncbi:hypothetical protein NNJEOMEG_03946 [Fundidesulfovibrio magnetotacticus]|uniref:DUF2269 family protein n=1 Tax=Fundidesulfovibrio magnetotacticus TaxID=2730080 RepID=A0A6V8LUD2_9BACT|nr:hypothetical protein [Fundidesulfovibrio magnetotacticus]GFK96072.1 hypothetical protein NNJEOMEG_03946 [Fundidesulfovibrio magnetotacticus]